MYCSKCGNKIRDGAQFCSNCGAPVRNRSVESYTKAVELALAGDERGFSYLYEQTYKSKYYLAMKYMGSREEAEDVLQDAYIKAFSKLNTLKEPETFPSWLGTILANTAKNALQKKNPVLFSDLPSSDEETDIPDFEIEDESLDYQPEAAYTRQETEELVREMIGSLSEEQKMCILMYYIDGESVRDIAEALDCSESAVKSRLSYGRKNLKAKAEEMQKKGYKLFTLAPIPLLFTLIHKDAEAAVCEKEFIAAGRRIAREVLQKATQIAKTAAASQAGGTGAAAYQAGTGTVVKVAAGAGAAGKGGAGAGAVVGFINTVAGKVVISVVVAVVVIGGIGGGVYAHRVNQSKEEAAVYEDDSVPEELVQSGSDDTGTTLNPFDDASESETVATEDMAENNALSDMSVQGLLELFPYMADNLLYQYYDGNEAVVNFLNRGITRADQVYWLAAIAVYESSGYINYSDEAKSIEIKSSEGIYYNYLPAELYADTLRNMFGGGYDISDFIETPGCVIRDSDGTFYVVAGEYGHDAVEVTIEGVSDALEADGTYLALAKYSGYDPDTGVVMSEYYMLYRVRPDESSDYGCVIVDMIPAGEGEIDESSEANELSVSSVQGLLETFPYMANSVLREYYNGSGYSNLENGITSDDQVYFFAAFATTDPNRALIYPDMQTHDQEMIDGVWYDVLPADLYAEYLRNMFGDEYDIYEFIETKDHVIRDNGNFYVWASDYGDGGVEITIENMSTMPDDNGTYSVLAKYSDYDPDTGVVMNEYYMLYRVRPDESSDYGCVIVDMIPAGNGEIDESVSTDSDTNATSVDSTGLSEIETDNEGEESGTSTAGWKDMYRDYLTSTLEFYDTDFGANCKYSLMPGGNYTFALIYLNDDDIPELLIFNDDTTSGSPYAYRLCTLRDGMFKDVSYSNKPLQEFSYIERSSLFYESCSQDGDMHDKLGRMIINDGGFLTPDSEAVYNFYYYADTGEYEMDYGERVIGEKTYLPTVVNLTKDEYENYKSQLKAYLEENNAITPEMVSEEEILKMLE